MDIFLQTSLIEYLDFNTVCILFPNDVITKVWDTIKSNVELMLLILSERQMNSIEWIQANGHLSMFMKDVILERSSTTPMLLFGITWLWKNVVSYVEEFEYRQQFISWTYRYVVEDDVVELVEAFMKEPQLPGMEYVWRMLEYSVQLIKPELVRLICENYDITSDTIVRLSLKHIYQYQLHYRASRGIFRIVTTDRLDSEIGRYLGNKYNIDWKNADPHTVVVIYE